MVKITCYIEMLKGASGLRGPRVPPGANLFAGLAGHIAAAIFLNGGAQAGIEIDL